LTCYYLVFSNYELGFDYSRKKYYYVNHEIGEFIWIDSMKGKIISALGKRKERLNDTG